MNEKSAYLCIRFQEGKWLSDDMMNWSGSESRIGQVSYLAMSQGSEKSFPETFLKDFFEKKSRKKLHSKNKPLTFASAFASKRKAKFFERF